MEPVEELPTLDLKAKKFFETLREKSFHKDDPLPEWRVVLEFEGDGEETCICSTPIQYKYCIENEYSKERLIIGSECIKRWNMNFRCKQCEAHLGNITKRLRTKNFLCPSCTKAKKLKDKLEKERQELRKRRLGHLTLFWFGPYYKKRFFEVINDIPYVNELLNIESDSMTIQYFKEYANLVYEIEPVEDDCEIQDS